MSKKNEPRRNMKFLGLLTTHPPFIKEVLEIRKIFKIPKDGFKKEEDVEQWQMNQVNEQDVFMESERWKRIEKQISTDFKSKKIERGMANKQIKIIMDESPINLFTHSVEKLIERFKLPINNKMTLITYILYGNLSWINSNNFSFRVEKDKINFEIYSRLTKEEIDDLVKYIRTFSKNLPHITKVNSKTDKQLLIESSLNMENNSGEKINANDLMKEYLGKKESVQKIYDAKRLLNKKRYKRFG
jgi:hypothetical protein